MNLLLRACTTVCEELGVDVPSPDEQGRYTLIVGELTLRFGPWQQGEIVLEGILGHLGPHAAQSWESQQDLLRQILTWNLAHLKAAARPEVLSFDETENLLLLWRTWPADDRLTSNLLSGVEQMLNELEFWRSRILSVAPGFGQEGVSP